MTEKVEIERKYDVVIQGVGVEPTSIDYLSAVIRRLGSRGLLFRTDIAYAPIVEHYFFNSDSGQRRRISEYENHQLISVSKIPIKREGVQINRELETNLEGPLEWIIEDWRKQGLDYFGKLQKRRAKVIVSSGGVGYEICFDIMVGKFGQTRQVEVELFEDIEQQERIITSLNNLHSLLVETTDIVIPRGGEPWIIKKFLDTNKAKWQMLGELNGM